MGSAQSFTDAVIALRAVDPGLWPSEDEFRTSVERLGIGGAATTEREKSLARLMEVVFALRDEIINDAADEATKLAVSNTQASNVVAAASVVRSVLHEGGSLEGVLGPSAPAASGKPAFDDLFA